MIDGVIQLPFDVPLLPVKILKAGEISCIYERGNLRQVAFDGEEIVQMIYPAVRGKNWETALSEITDEKIICDDKSFEISYTAIFRLNQIHYRSTIKITGRKDNSIVFAMHGEALDNFERRRIGLCVLHPIASCKEKSVTITRPDKTTYTAIFPEYISPHQPFIDVQQMYWTNDQNHAVKLIFEGDVFETEDQRNWTDNSYKTYSTPLDRPSPVLVEKGAMLEQQVVLIIRKDETISNKKTEIGKNEIDNEKINFEVINNTEISNAEIRNDMTNIDEISYTKIRNDKIKIDEIHHAEINTDDSSNAEISNYESSHNEIRDALKEEKIPFPKIGYSRIPGNKLLTSTEIAALKKVPFDHYRVELFMSLPHWQEELQAAISEAEKLNTLLELVVFFSGKAESEINQLVQELNKYENLINSLLPLHIEHDVTPAFLSELLFSKFKSKFPSIKIGYGTNAYFAALNRNRPVNIDYDFVSFSLNPQVHATDTRTIMENLKSQQQILDSIRQFTSKPVHLSPITFQQRNKTENDPRLKSYFGTTWTLISIRNLSKAGSITLYQTTGDKGIVVNTELSENTISPLYEIFVQLKEFQPVYVVRNEKKDEIIFENEKGKRLIYKTQNYFS